ncbi:PAAR domain-containing protein [Halomonas cupida]|uniref:PAAR domain-containing protein n=1 Tax=Halomonas cupida TaxID=44933 RepID=UPI003EF93931
MFGPGDGVIRVGDSSSHGGTVVTGQANYLVNGIPVAVVGDMVACPQKGHGVCPIVEGHPTFFVNGKAVAFHGCSTACGATLLSSTTHYHAIGSPNAPTYADTPPPHQYQQRASSTELVSGSPKISTADTPPIINLESDRWVSIIQNTPAIFEISDNPNASSKEPWYEFDRFDEVDGNELAYESVSRQVGVEAGLLKAIAYLETTHGYYDRINPKNRSFRPMNLNYEYWKPLADEVGFTRDEVINHPYPNIYVAAVLLKRIQERISSPTIEKVASIYNALGAEHVSDYGKRTKFIYDHQLWINRK